MNRRLLQVVFIPSAGVKTTRFRLMYEENPGETDFGSSWREVPVDGGSSCRESTVYLETCRESTEKEAKVLKKLYARGKIIKQSFENMKNYEELGGFYPPWQKDNTEYPLSV